LKARQEFEKARAERPDLQGFADAVALLDYLNARNGDLDEKDRILAALIEMAQSGGSGSDLAASLLWLGLWPALDAIYRRRLYAFIARPEELVSEIGIIFTTTIRHADLSHIHRVAATLVRNVERDVKEGRRRAWADEARFIELPEDDKLDDDDDEEGGEPKKKRGGRGARGLSDLGLVPGLTLDQQVAAIRETLVEIVGDDADLVIGALLYEESQREVGDRLGLTHEAARKRFQRAMEKIRSHFKGNS
jgi:RNA polymerase sigma-70 factor (ECF subfamily)